MGYDERHVLPSLRLLPYDRLVLVAGRETVRSAGVRRLRALEPALRVVRVDPFNLMGALESIRRTIRSAATDGSVRISASGGTKILTNAAILAAFQEGVEAWYCDPGPVRLPVLRGVNLDAALSPAERAIARALHGQIGHDRFVSAVSSQGFARRTVLGALQSLVTKGLVEMGRDLGPVWVQPSPRFALFRDHFREVPKKG